MSIDQQQPGAAPRRRATGFVTVLLVLGTVALGLPSSGAAQDGDKPTLLLLPIVVHSSENPEYLRAGLADMLASRFIQAGSFEITRIDEPGKAPTRLADALDAAREEGTDFVLFGSFTRFGEGASLDMQAAATAEGEEGQTLREIFVHSGSIGQVIPDLTDLVGKVTRFAIPGFEPAPAAAAPTGGAAPRRDDLADLRRRIAALEQAVQALEQGGSGGQ